MPSLPPSLTSTLQSYLEGQRVAGHQKIPWNDVLPSDRSGPPPPPPAPAVPTPAPPLEKDPKPAVLPPAPSAKPMVSPSAPRIAWVLAERHPECPPPDGDAAPSLLVICDEEEFRGEPGTLLKEMLYAIGFVPVGEPADFSTGLPEDASRILVMGNTPLQSASEAGVDLQLIRGFWQDFPQGRGLATYAPSDVTDSPSGKKTVWNDLQSLLEDLSLEIPEWTRKRLKRK